MRTLRQTYLFSLSAAAMSLAATFASATDVLSQDAVGHVLTVTTSAGPQAVQIASKEDLIGICEGCIITLENGQAVEAKADDLVFIVDGVLSIHED